MNELANIETHVSNQTKIFLQRHLKLTHQPRHNRLSKRALPFQNTQQLSDTKRLTRTATKRLRQERIDKRIDSDNEDNHSDSQRESVVEIATVNAEKYPHPRHESAVEVDEENLANHSDPQRESVAEHINSKDSSEFELPKELLHTSDCSGVTSLSWSPAVRNKAKLTVTETVVAPVIMAEKFVGKSVIDDLIVNYIRMGFSADYAVKEAYNQPRQVGSINTHSNEPNLRTGVTAHYAENEANRQLEQVKSVETHINEPRSLSNVSQTHMLTTRLTPTTLQDT